jgi:hypothetical protein
MLPPGANALNSPRIPRCTPTTWQAVRTMVAVACRVGPHNRVHSPRGNQGSRLRAEITLNGDAPCRTW